MSVKFDPRHYMAFMLEARKKAAPAARELVEAHAGKLPLIVTLRVGDVTYDFDTPELFRETGARFVRSILESPASGGAVEVALDPADVPAAETSIGFMQLRAPEAMTTAQLADVVQALSYCNAVAALAAITEMMALPHGLRVVESSVLLTAFIRVHKDAAAISKVECALHSPGSAGEVFAFWNGLTPVVTSALLDELQAAAANTGARWLWYTLKPLVCDGTSCQAVADKDRPSMPMLLPSYPPNYGANPARVLLFEFLKRTHGKPLCHCRASFVLYLYDSASTR